MEFPFPDVFVLPIGLTIMYNTIINTKLGHLFCLTRSGNSDGLRALTSSFLRAALRKALLHVKHRVFRPSRGQFSGVVTRGSSHSAELHTSTTAD